MATWPKGFLMEFVEEFRGHPSIWKVKSKEYHNREMKESAYAALIVTVACSLICLPVYLRVYEEGKGEAKL
jgi:hypothetical protein